MKYVVIQWTVIGDITYPQRFDDVQAAQWIAALWSISHLDAGVYEDVSPGVCHRTYVRGLLAYAKDAIGIRRGVDYGNYGYQEA